jgi:hypothetical protein
MATGNLGRSDGDLRSRIRGWLPWILIGLLGLGPWLACSMVGPVTGGGDLGLKASPDWSRGLHVGTGFYGRDSGAPLVVDGRGRVHLVWARRLDANQYDLQYVRVDDRGVVEDDHELGVSLYEPRQLRVLLDSRERIHVFLLASWGKEDLTGLFHLILADDGRLDSAPTLLSSGDSPCYEYDVAVGSGSTMQLFWTEGMGTERRLFYSALEPDRATGTTARLLATGVSAPVVTSDAGGYLHLLWEQPGEVEDQAELYYAVLTDGVPESLSGVKLLDLPSGSHYLREGPVVALDHDYGYLVWTVVDRIEPDPKAISQGWYASFRLDSPTSALAREFSLPTAEHPTYVLHGSPYGYQYLALPDGDTPFGVTRITGPYALAGQEEAVVSVGTAVSRGLGMENQIANVIFADGDLVGYQLVCNTRHWSRLPNLVSDSSGNLHVSWIDGLESAPSEVYYAATSALVRSRVDHTTVDDVVLAVLDIAFATTSGLPMIPFAVVWVAPSLIVAFVFERLLGERGVRSPAGYAALAVCILSYQLVKFHSTPELTVYVPFSISMPFLSARAYALLRILVPALVAGLGVVSVVYGLVRAEVRSLLAATLLFVLVDAVLTVLVYGPAFAT